MQAKTLVGRTNVVLKTVEGSLNLGKLDQIIKESYVMGLDAIPIEQLKGDIARAGHPVKQALALDADGRRLFFTDVAGEHLYAEFDTAQNGHRVLRIGHQSSIVKEYDVQELEPDDKGSVTTTHEEGKEAIEEPGMYPSGTPLNKPEEDNRGFGSEANLEARKALLLELEH